MKEALRVYLVDDHAVVREGFAALIGLDPAYAVVGQAATCVDAIIGILRERPDLVVADYYLPDGAGTGIIRALAMEGLNIPVLIMTSSEQDETVYRSLNEGASGYMIKSSGPDELFSAMQAIAAGGTWLSLSLRSALTPPDPSQTLTARERSIIDLLAEGSPNDEISARLGISIATVKTHIYNLMGKLQARNRAEAVHKARQRGLIA